MLRNAINLVFAENSDYGRLTVDLPSVTVGY